MRWGEAKTQLLYTLPEVAALEGSSDLRTRPSAFQPPRHKPIYILGTLPPFSMFLITLEQKFPCFSTGQPNSEPNYQKLSPVHLRPYKSYTRAIYLCASRPAPPDILKLIFQSLVHRFRGRFNLGSHNLQ